MLLQVVPESKIGRRQLSPYLNAGGQTVSECSFGSVYNILGGKLYTDGHSYSASAGAPSTLFKATGAQGVNTIFAVTDGELFWDNEAFEGRTARFCINAQKKVYAVFHGALSADCTPVMIKTVAGASKVERKST